MLHLLQLEASTSPHPPTFHSLLSSYKTIIIPMGRRPCLPRAPCQVGVMMMMMMMSSMSVSPPPVSNTPPKSDSPRDSVVSMSQATLKQRVNMVVMRMIAQNSDHDQRQQTQTQRQSDQAFPQAINDNSSRGEEKWNLKNID